MRRALEAIRAGLLRNLARKVAIRALTKSPAARIAAGQMRLYVKPVDDHIRLGVLEEAIPTPRPITPGLDVAGTIVELGEGVTGFRIDDLVIGMFR